MKQFLAVMRYALDHRPALLVTMLLPVLVTMLVAVAAPTVPTMVAAFIAVPAAMAAWGGGMLAGKLHEQESTPLTSGMSEEPPAADEPAERRKRAA